MQSVFAFLSGYKTYLVALCGILYSLGIGLSWWPHSAAFDLLLGSTGLITIRAAIAKALRVVADAVEQIPPQVKLALTCLSPTLGVACSLVVAFGLSSCSTLGPVSPDETRAITSVAVSNGLQFGIKDAAQRGAVASQMVQAIGLYTQYSNGGVPTPEQFQALLNQYLPAGSTKALTVSNLTALYTLRYSTFKDLKIPDQAGYFNSFLSGVKDGAGPFVSPLP